jgi:hypothetical protein
MGRGKRWPRRDSDEPAGAVKVENFDRFSKRIRIPKSHDFRLFSIIGSNHRRRCKRKRCRIMRVLMPGWKFLSFISGCIGTASYRSTGDEK